MEIREKCIHCKGTTEVSNCTFKDCVLNFSPGFYCCRCNKPTPMATGSIRTDGELSQDHDPCQEPGRTVEMEGGVEEASDKGNVKKPNERNGCKKKAHTPKRRQRSKGEGVRTKTLESNEISQNGKVFQEMGEDNDDGQLSLTTSTRSDLSLSLRSNDSVAAVMPCYIKGQPMPNSRYCLFRQSHAGKAAKQKFFDKLRRKSKYYSLVLTKDLVVCVSDRSSNVIEFTVDLCKDEYVHEEGELEDKLHVHENGEELCFNTSTTPILREKISGIKSKTMPPLSDTEKPQMRERKANSCLEKSRKSFGKPFTKRVLGKKGSVHGESQENIELLSSPGTSISPSMSRMTNQDEGMHNEERTTDSGQTSEIEYVGGTTPDRESLRYATGSFPQQCVDEEELHMPEVCEQQSDDNVESDHLVGGATRMAFRRKKTSNFPHTQKTARGDVQNDESMPYVGLDDVEAVQKPSTISHSKGSLCSFEMSRQTSGEDKEDILTAVPCEHRDGNKTEYVANEGSTSHSLLSKQLSVPNCDAVQLLPRWLRRHKSEAFLLENVSGHCPSQSNGMLLFPIIELFKWEVSYLLPDYYEWSECANLLDISSMAQRDISECCFYPRRYYETVDAFEFDVHPRTPESLLEKLQEKFPELKDKFTSCLAHAQSFQLPSLDCLNMPESKLQQEPTVSLLQRVADCPSLCLLAFFTGRLLGLSRDQVKLCETITYEKKNPAEQFLFQILLKWKLESRCGQCTVAALLRVLLYLNDHNAIKIVYNMRSSTGLEL